MVQKCFRGMKPSLPTIRTPRVARRIAERIVAEVNLDEFYWEKEEFSCRIEDVTEELVRCGHPATVFSRLNRQQSPVSDAGERAVRPYGWEGIDEHCRHIADAIADEILTEETKKHKQLYG